MMLRSVRIVLLLRLNCQVLLLTLIVLFNHVSVVIVKIALEIGHVCLETVLRQVGHDKRLLSRGETLVLDDPLTAVLQHLDTSN